MKSIYLQELRQFLECPGEGAQSRGPVQVEPVDLRLGVELGVDCLDASFEGDWRQEVASVLQPGQADVRLELDLVEEVLLAARRGIGAAPDRVEVFAPAELGAVVAEATEKVQLIFF